MDLGKRIHKLRINADLTQEQLAEQLDISRQSVTKWENNLSSPDIGKLIELSQFFGVSLDYLIKGRNEYAKYSQYEMNNPEVVKSFLCRAKRNTYAGYGAEKESSRPQSHDLFYEEGNLSYLDSYFGGEKFIGEEVLYMDRRSYWAMNYSGRVLEGNFSSDFLKECLSAVDTDLPYRGPSLYQNGNFTYHCSVKGAFEWFTGEEEMFFHTKKVYECIFHGGIIS